jgi:uncharacterized protein
VDDHPGKERVQEYLTLLGQGELDKLGDFYTDDVVWHVGGDHALAGTYRGRDALLDYFARVRELTDGTLRVEPEEILTSDKHTVMFSRTTAQRDGKRLDVLISQFFEVGKDGRWSQYWALADDPAAVNAFWANA